MTDAVFGERFISRGGPAWHAIGKVFEIWRKLSVRQAFEEVGINYEFAKFPIYAAMPDGTQIAMPKAGLYRSPTHDDNQWRFIDTVESDYGVIQPLELADALGVLCEKYPVETAGALHDGATNFATLKLDSYDIRGEEMNQYFLLANSNGINRSLRILVTDIRVVCQNTLNAAINSAQLQVSIPHTANIKRDMDIYIKIVASAEEAAQKQRDLFRQMAATPIARDGLLTILNAAWPDPKRPQRARILGEALERQGLEVGAMKLYDRETKAWESARERAAQFRAAGEELFNAWGDREMGGKATVGTVWAAVNAVAEVSDNRLGNSLESAAVATLFGDRYRERLNAMTAASKYTADYASAMAGVN